VHGDAAQLVLVGDDLDLEDDVVLDVDHVRRHGEVKVVPLVGAARGALEVLDGQRLVGNGRRVVGRRVHQLDAV